MVIGVGLVVGIGSVGRHLGNRTLLQDFLHLRNTLVFPFCGRTGKDTLGGHKIRTVSNEQLDRRFIQRTVQHQLPVQSQHQVSGKGRIDVARELLIPIPELCSCLCLLLFCQSLLRSGELSSKAD